jgi:hypothetical protein
MNIISKDIKTIKDLRKYVNSIDWYNKKWNENDNDQFHYNLIVKDNTRLNVADVKGSFTGISGNDKYRFGEVFFKTTISKKKQAKVYKLAWSTEQVSFNRYGRSETESRIDVDIYNKYKDKDQSIRAYSLKNKFSYSDYYISNVFIYANEYTDEIVYVSYDSKDIWWNNFFRDCLDTSIKNNFNELNRVKKYNIVLEKREYKTILAEGKTFDEAMKSFYKNNPEINEKHTDSRYNILPNTWFASGTTALDKLPENKNLSDNRNIALGFYGTGKDVRELGQLYKS